MSDGGDKAQDILDWGNAAQGDILELSTLGYWNDSFPGCVECFTTPEGIVLISQTCDLVQVGSKDRVLVAPVISCSKEEKSQIKKGQRPLRILVGRSLDKFADLERITSIPRKTLTGVKVLDRTSESQSGRSASQLAERIARGFSRFAFPDEVHEALRKFRDKIIKAYSKDSDFAKVLSTVEEFRIGCNDWNEVGRHLRICAIISSELLPPVDMRLDGWTWSEEYVHGATSSMKPENLDLEAISRLILLNHECRNDSALVTLWHLWADQLKLGWLESKDPEVKSIELEALSTAEFSYKDYLETEALDFSTLSFSWQ